MSKDLSKYYDDRFTLFATAGWKDFIEDLDTRIEAIQSVKGIKDMETLFKRQGELDTLEWIKSLPDLSKEAYDQLKADGEIK